MAKKKADKKPKGESPEGDDSPKSGKGGLIGALLTPLILGGVSFAAVFMLPSPTAPYDSDASEPSAEHEPISDTYEKPDVKTDIVSLDQMTLSINRGQNILRINLALEVPSEKRETVNPADPRLRDAFMGYLRAVDIAGLEDAAFMPQLREQLLRRSKLVLGNETVTAILITDFLIR